MTLVCFILMLCYAVQKASDFQRFKLLTLLLSTMVGCLLKFVWMCHALHACTKHVVVGGGRYVLKDCGVGTQHEYVDSA